MRQRFPTPPERVDDELDAAAMDAVAEGLRYGHGSCQAPGPCSSARSSHRSSRGRLKAPRFLEVSHFQEAYPTLTPNPSTSANSNRCLSRPTLEAAVPWHLDTGISQVNV